MNEWNCELALLERLNY